MAGGGAGACDGWRLKSIEASGGSGGGYIGGSTILNFDSSTDSTRQATGGTQTSAGLSGGNPDGHARTGEWLGGKFGIGGGRLAWGDSSATGVSGGGGGGYYGGGASWGGSGGGGSGYIANTRLINKGMYMYNQSCTASSATSTKTTCTNSYSSSAVSNYAKTGDGAARITYLGTSI